jgi:type II secretory pathway pseudopilin PulG
VELVVVVGIIVTLLSLVLAVSTLLIQQNESRQLESAFANLSSAVQEYELAVGRPITFQDRSDPNGVYDIQKNPEFRGSPALSMPYSQSGLTGMLCAGCDEPSEPLNYQGWCKFNVKLFSLLARTQSAEEIVARLDPALLTPLRKSNGNWTGSEDGEDALQALVDPWGTPVAVVMPGRRWREGVDSGVPDSDGTIRTFFENKAGVCRNGKPLFVSAGPDGDLGCRTCDGLRGEAAIDNVYSYDPEA